MLRGHLKLLVLRELRKHELSGYALMKKIEEAVDHRPSPGSIYPLLDGLKRDGYVNYEKEKKKKIYALTSKGRTYLQVIMQQKQDILNNIMKLHDMLEVSAKDQEKVKSLLKKNEEIEDTLQPELALFLKELFQVALEIKKKKGIKAVLRSARKKLKALS